MTNRHKTYEAASLNDLPAIAKQFLKDWKGEQLFALEGIMGAGKTTFVKAICDALMVEDTVSSPTFSIVNEYTAADGQTLFHFDFYRLKSPQEALDFGLEEYLHSDAICLMEWVEKIEGLLPDGVIQVKIEEQENGKRIFSVDELIY